LLQTVIFAVFGAIAVASALAVVYFRNPVYSALALVTTLFAIAGLFVLLEAYFVAVVQVIVYAGAIMVLFLFVIMLLNLREEELLAEHLGWVKRIAVFIAGLFFAEIGYIVFQVVNAMRSPQEGAAAVGDPQTVGELLFSKYLLPFEVTSLILLAALIGVMALVQRRSKELS